MIRDKTIEIVYLVTGSYKQFMPDFFNTVDLFFPECKKIITILSDDLHCCDNISVKNNNIFINAKQIIHLPYPFVSYFKYLYTKEYCSWQADYIFYFDADTIFVKNDKVDFEKILNIADTKILLSLHPFYADPSNIALVDTFYDYNTERNPKFLSCINSEKYDYVIGSFFGGNIKDIKVLCDSICNMMQEDLKNSDRLWYIPKFMDEAYLNSIALNNKNLLFDKQQFVILYTCNNFSDFTFCKQKHFPQDKKERVIY